MFFAEFYSILCILFSTLCNCGINLNLQILIFLFSFSEEKRVNCLLGLLYQVDKMSEIFTLLPMNDSAVSIILCK